MRAFCLSAIRNKRRNRNAIFRVIITCRDTVMSWIDYALSLMDKSWLGTLLGIVGLIFGLVTYLWTRKRTSLGYVHLGEHLLGSTSDTLPSAIVVQYNGINIPRLTKSILIFWNSGENTVLGSDIVAKDPLRFHVGGDGQILAIAVLKVTRPVNDFSLIPLGKETNEAEFTFNFLDVNDGFVVEILHTSTDRQPRIKGTLRGLPQGFRNFGRFTRPKPQKKSKNRNLSFGLKLMMTGAALVLLVVISRSRGSSLETSGDFGVLIASFLGGFVGMWICSTYFSRRRYPKSLHTEALE